MKINNFLVRTTFLSIFTLVFLVADVQAQTYDTVSRARRYKELTEKFNTEPITKNDIIFLGNSITAGGNWAKLLNLPNAKNRGISGDITFGVLERLQEIIDRKPSKVFILIGTNDIAKRIPDSLILRNLKSIVKRMREGTKKTKIYFYTILPENNTFPKRQAFDKEPHVVYLNSEIKKFTAKNVTVIDLYAHFIDSEKKLKKELTTDGLHLNPEGYKIWANLLLEGGYLK